MAINNLTAYNFVVDILISCSNINGKFTKGSSFGSSAIFSLINACRLLSHPRGWFGFIWTWIVMIYLDFLSLGRPLRNVQISRRIQAIEEYYFPVENSKWYNETTKGLYQSTTPSY